MKKTAALVLAMILLLSMAACGEKKESYEAQETPNAAIDIDNIYYQVSGIDPAQTVTKYNDVEIPMSLFGYFLCFNMSGTEYQMASYREMGYYEEMFNEDGNLNWDYAAESGLTVADYSLLDAKYNMAFYAAIQELAEKYHITQSEEDKADMQESKKEMIDSVGGEAAYQDYLHDTGLSEENYEWISTLSGYYDGLVALVTTEGSDFYMDDAALLKFYDENLKGEGGNDLDLSDEEMKNALCERIMTAFISDYTTKMTVEESEFVQNLVPKDFYMEYLKVLGIA